MLSGLMACDNCQQFCQTERISTGDEYRRLIRELIVHVNNRVLTLVDGLPLGPIAVENSMWPDDIIDHLFECPQCHQKFTLSVNTYAGRGGYWRPAR